MSETRDQYKPTHTPVYVQADLNAAVKAERERCAGIAETHSATDCDGPDCGVVIAAAIREGKPQE